MKTTFIALITLAFLGHLSGQDNKFYLSLEYSPNMTAVSARYTTPDDGTFRFASNIFAKAGYRLTGNLYANAGIGYLTSKEFVSVDYGSNFDISRIEQLRINGYVVTPVGFTYYMGSFFVNPEIGIGWNVSNKFNNAIYYPDGSVTGSKGVDEQNINGVNNITYPIFLTIGDEIRFNTWSVLLGLKGYYGLNEIGGRPTYPRHYYGFGIIAGVKF